MRARDVVGRKIVRVVQQRVPADECRPAYTHLEALVLDNGVTITFSVVETETGEYGLEAVLAKEASL